MSNVKNAALTSVVSLCMLAILACVPLVAHAKTDMEASVRASLLSDPRSADIPEAEFEALVAALTAQAESESIPPEQISYWGMNPQSEGVEGASNGILGLLVPVSLALAILAVLYYILRYLKTRAVRA